MKRNMITLAVALALCLNLVGVAGAYHTGTVGQTNRASAGGYNAAYVDDDGSLWVWGDDGARQVGTSGRYYIVGEPVLLLHDVASVSMGWFSATAAIKKDGSLWIWGKGYLTGIPGAGNYPVDSYVDGKLVKGMYRYQTYPLKVMEGVSAVSVGEAHVAAIKTDGSLWVWGENQFGQLGTGNKDSSKIPVKVMDDVASVCAGSACTAAIKTDGSLWIWGSIKPQILTEKLPTDTDSPYFFDEQLVPRKFMDDVAVVSVGSSNAYNSYCTVTSGYPADIAVIKTDGTLWIWGESSSYQPVKMLDNAVSVSVGVGKYPNNTTNITAITQDGTLWAWGSYEILGIGDLLKGSDTPVKVMDHVTEAYAGERFAAAVRTDGSLWTWGMSTNCSLGGYGGDFVDLEREGIWRVSPTQVLVGNCVVSELPKPTPAESPETQPSASPSPSVSPAPAQPSAATGTNFEDVAVGMWYEAPIQWAAEQKIISTTEKKFRPDEICNNADIIQFIWNACGQPAPTISNPFVDVPEDASYRDAAIWTIEADIIHSDTFHPNWYCTRAMAVYYLWKAQGSPKPTQTDSFTDVDSSATYAEAVAWAVEEGITDGVGDNQFAPKANCTRAQIVTFLYRAFHESEAST